MDIADLISQLTNDGEDVKEVEIWDNYKPQNYNLADYINSRVYTFQLLENGKLRVHI